MPAEYHKYGHRDNRKRHSSSSSSSSSPRRDSKSYRHEKWHKRSRSRSRSSPRHDNRYRHGDYYPNKDQRKSYSRPYEGRRDDYRKTGPPQPRRIDQKTKDQKYNYYRNEQRDKNRLEWEPKASINREKSAEKKRWQSSASSKSVASVERKHSREISKTHEKPVEPKKEQVREASRDESRYKDKNSRYQEGDKRQKREGNYREYDKGKNQLDSSRQYIEKTSQFKPKNVRMAVPPPPPPAQYGFPRQYSESEPHKDYREHRQEDRSHRDELPKKFEYHEPKKFDYKRQEYRHHATADRIQNQTGRISPIKRPQQTRKELLKIEANAPETEKVKASRFQMIMNEAKMNLIVPPPPINFLALDTFRSLNKFQVQTMDQRWSIILRAESQRISDLKQLLPDLPKEPLQAQGRLWTYLKQQRSQQELQLRLRLQELRLHNSTIAELRRKLKVLE